MSSLSEFYLPQTLPYPVKIASIDAQPGDSVQRGTRLLSYSFIYVSAALQTQPETRFGTWDCTVEGTLSSWNVRVGDVISAERAKQRVIVTIDEPCKHGVQVGGMCGLCGKDMTDYDYTGFSNASRASIQMTHSAFGPTVSLEEAQRIERETAEHLLKSRKLSLIVDLDQTIVHATVDPTVGEWINEGKQWEQKHGQKQKAKGEKGDDIDSDATSSSDEEDCNPNWEALKDVKSFRLGPESFVMPYAQKRGKQKSVENDGCLYYVKPRPGWREFFDELSKKYEMHVYTMGTRAYAEEVCAAIDPDGKIFGGRILSRDESGSLTQKSLQRLFPCDTSMVVIIDDRADVWEWSPNLIKVIPYDFFIGIGDINSAFLPKVEPLAAAAPTKKPSAPSETQSGSPPSEEEIERNEAASDAVLNQNSRDLKAQVEERPLAKKQEELQGSSTSQSNGEKPETGSETPPAAQEQGESAATESATSDKASRKALLKNDDTELKRVGGLLEEVHARFFGLYDSRSTDASSKKRKSGPKAPKSYDVTRIIPEIRANVLDGVHILFSSVIPLDTSPETTEIWKVAHMFGAKCYTELSSSITHVVAARVGTVKVDAARRRGGVKIVWLSWFTDSVALWRRMDEAHYFLEEPAARQASPNLDPNQISSDPEPDADDWDEDEDSGADGSRSLQLDAIDWNDINDEVEAAMNESDTDGDGDGDGDDDDMSDRGSVKSSTSVSELGVSPSAPRSQRKRLRSLTPSEAGLNGGSDSDLRSPLSKRKKLAADRSGASRLKEAITADELTRNRDRNSRASTPSRLSIAEVDEEEEDGDGDDMEDDFLARELGDWEEELG